MFVDYTLVHSVYSLAILTFSKSLCFKLGKKVLNIKTTISGLKCLVDILMKLVYYCYKIITNILFIMKIINDNRKQINIRKTFLKRTLVGYFRQTKQTNKSNQHERS